MGARVRPRLEKDVQKEILLWLKLHGFLAWRNNTGAGKLRSGHFVRWGCVGSGDVLILVPPEGRLVSVECKRPGGRITEAQAAWMDAVRGAGGVAFVATSVEDLETALRAEGLFPCPPAALGSGRPGVRMGGPAQER